jgi:hypothetical protein
MNNFGKVYERVEKKVKDGIFVEGEDYRFRMAFPIQDISLFEEEDRIPENCAWQMHYSKCRLSQVPKESLTREFLLNTFTCNDVFTYIKENIGLFDRQFFKDVIKTEHYSLYFGNNCFAAMPLDMIDEEMCSLAILSDTEWASHSWFDSVLERKPEALTNDIWKLAARFYSQTMDVVELCPDEYKDEEFWFEACSPTVGNGFSLTDHKYGIMDRVPDEFMTGEFLKRLLDEDGTNISRFNEKGLNCVLKDCNNIPAWRYAIMLDVKSIEYIPLNEERIAFFTKCYGPDTWQYDLYFKDKYKDYKKAIA